MDSYNNISNAVLIWKLFLCTREHNEVPSWVLPGRVLIAKRMAGTWGIQLHGEPPPSNTSDLLQLDEIRRELEAKVDVALVAYNEVSSSSITRAEAFRDF